GDGELQMAVSLDLAALDERLASEIDQAGQWLCVPRGVVLDDEIGQPELSHAERDRAIEITIAIPMNGGLRPNVGEWPLPLIEAARFPLRRCKELAGLLVENDPVAGFGELVRDEVRLTKHGEGVRPVGPKRKYRHER